MTRKQKTACVLAGLLLTVMAAFIVIGMENRDYQDKMVILNRMLETEGDWDDAIASAASLLKGNQGADAEGREDLLDAYGYGAEFENVYRRHLHFEWAVTGGTALICFGGWISMMYFLEHSFIKRRSRENEQIRNAILAIRTEDLSEGGKKDNWDIAWEDAGQNSVYMELDSLASYVALTRERAKEEKEETKTLVTDISHQLKTPIAALRTSFEILNTQDLTSEEQMEFGERCENQIIRLQELAAALVNISRMEKGIIEIRKEEQCIFDTVVLAMNRVWQMSQEKRIEIVLEADEKMQELILWHDKKWISEALINILENAVKYSPADTAITMRMIPMNLFLRIEIEDEGIGIPKEEWNRIFQRFYRGENETVKKAPGSGVGLFLARTILEQHQGMLSVSAPIGKKYGSIFILQIPYQKS